MEGVPVSVKDFGAVGDGVADDTAAIQAAINSGAKTILFPEPSVTYRITDSLRIGAFSIDSGTGNVLGFALTKHGISLIGEADARVSNKPTLTWDGPDQPGTTKVTKSDSVGTYPFITDAKAMLHIIQSLHVKISGIRFVGATGSNKAFACVHTEGFCTQYIVERCSFEDARIGFRNGTNWDYANSVPYFGYVDSPWHKANVGNTPALGGFQNDSHSYISCIWTGASIASYSSESAQALQIQFQSCQMAGTGTQNIFLAGGWLTLNSCGFAGSGLDQDILHTTGGGQLELIACHSESDATWTFRSNQAGVPVTISNSDSAAVYLAGTAGGDRISIDGCNGVKFRKDDSAANTVNASITNSTVSEITIANTGDRKNIALTLENVKLTTNVLTGATANNIVLRTANVGPAGFFERTNGDYFSPYEKVINGVNYVRTDADLVIPHNSATVVGTINVPGNANSGYAFLQMTARVGPSGTSIIGTGRYMFGFHRKTDNTIGLTPVTAVATAFLGVTALTVTVADGGSGDVDISVLQTNTVSGSLRLVCTGEFFVGSFEGKSIANKFLWTNP